MGSVTFGDIFFIAMVGGGIYLLLRLVNRSGRKGASAEETTMNSGKKFEDPFPPAEGGRHGKSGHHS